MATLLQTRCSVHLRKRAGAAPHLAVLLVLLACGKPRTEGSAIVDAGAAKKRAATAVPAKAIALSPAPQAAPSSPESSLRLKFRWTDDHPPDPCVVRGQPQPPDSSRADCVSAQRVERWMSLGKQRELVGSPRCNEPGCGERPDLVLGYTYPNNQIFLLTPQGQRFPDVCRDIDNAFDAKRGEWQPRPRLRLRGRFESRRGVYVDDPRVFSGDNQPCDREPHPVFRVEAWCVEIRGARTPPQFSDGRDVPREHICGTPRPFWGE